METASAARRQGETMILTDLGDGHVAFRIAGPAAAEALNRLLPIDLHPRCFLRGVTALTLAAHIGVQLWREPDPDKSQTFLLIAPSSYATTMMHALHAACVKLNQPGKP